MNKFKHNFICIQKQRFIGGHERESERERERPSDASRWSDGGKRKEEKLQIRTTGANAHGLLLRHRFHFPLHLLQCFHLMLRLWGSAVSISHGLCEPDQGHMNNSAPHVFCRGELLFYSPLLKRTR